MASPMAFRSMKETSAIFSFLNSKMLYIRKYIMNNFGFNFNCMDHAFLTNFQDSQ